MNLRASSTVCIAHAYCVRNHWGIESMHWVLDTVFNEDKRRFKRVDAARNLSQVLKFVYHILMKDPTYAGKRHTKKRLRFACILDSCGSRGCVLLETCVRAMKCITLKRVISFLMQYLNPKGTEHVLFVPRPDDIPERSVSREAFHDRKNKTAETSYPGHW